MTPALVTVGLAILVLRGQLKQIPVADALFEAAKSGEATSLALFFGVALTLAVTLAYSALPMYRLLEGYYLPRPIAEAWRQKHQQRLTRLLALREIERESGIRPSGYSIEKLMAYPDEQAFIMPTMLGNSLRTLERFGVSRYGCDSQLLWYELQALAPESIRQDTHEGRAPVDFFISAIGCLGVLISLCLILAVTVDGRTAPLVLAVASAILIRGAYASAVRNMKDWAASVKALVNLCRFDVAERMRLEVPWWREGERHMWEQYIGAIEYNNASFITSYDDYRRAFFEHHFKGDISGSTVVNDSQGGVQSLDQEQS
jgi:hypothetical protein